MPYSQHDPVYGKDLLGGSKLSVYGFGCFLVSIANLYGVHPRALMKVIGGITKDGLVVSDVLARSCGGRALPRTKKAPKGWCIAVTDFYKKQGYPTHFFCVNMDSKVQIDPLDYPARIEPLTYPIIEFRPFTNVKNPEDNSGMSFFARWLQRRNKRIAS